MTKYLVAIFTLLFFGACSTLQVQHDYNPQYDFSKVHRIAVLYSQSSDHTVSLAQQRFEQAIKSSLRERGFEITDKTHADLYMLFHLDVSTQRQIVTDYQAVGIYPYRLRFYGGTMMIPVQREYTYTEGKIIIDAVDPHGNRVVWRGIATDRLHNFDTPQEKIAYIQKVAQKVLADFPPKK